MPLVYLEDLNPGMILENDLVSPGGRFILAAGAPLQEHSIKALKSWGIIEADIREASLDHRYREKQRIAASFKQQARGLLLERLVLNDPAREPLATLFRHLLHRIALQLRDGWVPALTVAAVAGGVPPGPPLSLSQLLKGDIPLFSLPLVYSQIVDLLSDSDASTYRIASVLDKDPGLTIRLLRMVNSPYYALTGKIESVSRAVSLLGTDELKNLALGISVVDQFRTIPAGVLDPEQFWRHSIRCGLFARALAEAAGEKDPQLYFTGGLLHDLGRLVMVERMPEHYLAAVSMARRQSLPMFRAEQDVLKVDHALVGRFLAERWRLSPPLIRMISGHHSPRLANYSREACLLHLGDIFAHTAGQETLLVDTVPRLQPRAWEELGLAKDLIAPILMRVEREFLETTRLFFPEQADPDVDETGQPSGTLLGHRADGGFS